MKKVATIVIGCLLSITILGFLMGWWGKGLNDASIALISALLVGATLLLGVLSKKAREEKRRSPKQD